jgi:RimJ/RimL family protein N-acetyltransferase
MLGYVFDRPEIVAPFVAAFIPECRERGFGACSTIGVIDEDGSLIGGIIYKNWVPEVGTVEISGGAIPGTNWLSRRTIQMMYDYPFYQLECQMVIMTTRADNEIVHRIMASVGFTLQTVRRLCGRDCDGVVGTLTLEDWEQSRYNVNRKRAEKADPQLTEAA